LDRQVVPGADVQLLNDEETFGPLAALIKFTDEDEVIVSMSGGGVKGGCR
jgi:acyl-CoA reductase-like NAD-dependent aldehyde dehydrogenase